MDTATRLRTGFPLPDRQDAPWGTLLSTLGTPRARQVGLPGEVELLGLQLRSTTVVGGGRDVVRTVTWTVDVVPDRDALEADLGPARVQAIPNRGRPHEVAGVWTWTLGEGVELAVSVYAAPREGAGAGVYLSASEERLAGPWLGELDAPAPWRTTGTVEPLGVTGLEPCALGDPEVALRRPGLVRPASWAPEGLWRSAGWWGLADGRVTCAFRVGAAVHLQHHRALPARGPGGASLDVAGTVVLVSADPHGLDGLVGRLAREPGVTVETHETHDC
ncbi:MAG: hypothetical protein H6734_06240 [Alphaproteobacteria bacterium]|nr:hypothetical protein [Alphaproteobacteria bacterium]